LRDGNNTLLMVVVYPGIEQYMRDYFTSINKQTYQGFDILILNDNLDIKYLDIPTSNILLEMPQGLTSGEIRYEGIKYAVDHSYNYLIFSDGDDYFSIDRIRLSVLFLGKNNFVYNDIIPVDANGKTILESKNNKYKFPDKISNFEEILDYNLFGMSNTGISVGELNNIYIPREIIAVDWWIYTILLLNGAVGKFIEGPTTFYRQSNNNLVGSRQNLDKKRLNISIKVKQAHYKYIHKYCQDNKMDTESLIYLSKFDEMNKLQLKIKDNIFVDKYINTVNENIDRIYKGWWSEVVSIQEFEKYENTVN